MRQHPQVLSLRFKEGLKRPEIDNAIDLYLRDDISEMEYKEWEKLFEVVPEKLTQQEKGAWLSRFTDVSYGSDAFIPFRDNIDRAAKSGVRYVAQAGARRGMKMRDPRLQRVWNGHVLYRTEAVPSLMASTRSVNENDMGNDRIVASV